MANVGRMDPYPIETPATCSLCAELWSDHERNAQGDVTAEACVKLLRARLDNSLQLPVLSTPHAIPMPYTPPVQGYRCGCGTWVALGSVHQCTGTYPSWYRPIVTSDVTGASDVTSNVTGASDVTVMVDGVWTSGNITYVHFRNPEDPPDAVGAVVR